jgi:hypothetical protein
MLFASFLFAAFWLPSLAQDFGIPSSWRVSILAMIYSRKMTMLTRITGIWYEPHEG